MPSFKSLFVSALLATSVMATQSQEGQGQQGWQDWQGQPQQGQPQQGHPQAQPQPQVVPPSHQQPPPAHQQPPPAHQQQPPPAPPVVAPPNPVAPAVCPTGCVPIGQAPPPVQQNPGELLVQVVSVADKNGSLKYFPNKIDAPVGSIVQFQFNPKNHTITESSFAEPCKPLAANLTSATRPGVRSGFIPVTGTEPFTPVYNVLINDTKPIWIFCGQTNHCQRGMAMVINQAKDGPNTIEKYIENAAQLPQVSPPAAAPPAAAPPAGAPPAGAPPAAGATASSTFTFGGGAAPPAATGVGAPPAPNQAPSSSVPVAPATFTGAASNVNARDASTFGLVALGALAALL